MKKSRIIGAVIVIALLGMGGFVLRLRHPFPEANPGPEGDALARALEQKVDIEAWHRTQAIRFSTKGRFHLWDRARGLARVTIGPTEVLLDLSTKKGVVKKSGHPADEPERTELNDRAYQWWVNDTFWLNPLVKLFDPGTVRAKTMVDGKPALMVTYTSGGLTPGDRYQWIIGDDGFPRAWRLWVSVLPVGGVEFSWEGWTRLSTGAQISTVHKALGKNAFPIDDLVGGTMLSEVEPGPDPFAELLSGK